MNDQERTVHFEARRTQWLSQLIEAVIFAQLVCKPGEHGVQELLKPILIALEPGRPWWFHVSLDISEPGYNGALLRGTRCLYQRLEDYHRASLC